MTQRNQSLRGNTVANAGRPRKECEHAVLEVSSDTRGRLKTKRKLSTWRKFMQEESFSSPFF